MSTDHNQPQLTHSYLALRKAVGWIGILLPFVVMFGVMLFFKQETTQSSISHYYYTSMRNVLVGSLCAVALFLFFYSGYDWKDNWTGNLAAVFAIGVAWMPTTEFGPTETIGILHFVCATIFFLLLAFFSIYLFTKTGKEVVMESRKKARNKIYVICGLVMIGCILAITIYVLFIQDNNPSYLIYWAETVALVAFGVSWLTKGGSISPDEGSILKL